MEIEENQEQKIQKAENLLKRVRNELEQNSFWESQKNNPLYQDRKQLERLLIARDWDEQKAFEMWKKWGEWRLEFKVDNLSALDIESELISGKAFMHGKDKKGNPIVIIKVMNHIPENSSVHKFLQFVVFLLEKVIQETDKPGGTGKVTVIWDRKGFSKKNFDLRFKELLKELAQMLQDNYAERLEKTFILYPSIFLKWAMAIFRPMLSEKIKSKISILDNVEDLQLYVEKDQLLVEYSGTSNYKYDPVQEFQLETLKQKLILEQNAQQSDCESFYSINNNSFEFYNNIQSNQHEQISNKGFQIQLENQISNSNQCFNCGIQKCNIF